MGKKLALTLAPGIALALGVATVAIAFETPYVSSCLRSTIGEMNGCQGPPGLIADFGARVVPEKLPKHEMAPVAIELWGKVAAGDGGHPSALKEVTIDFDRNLVVDAKGLAVCHVGSRSTVGRNSAPKACDGSVVGGGRAAFDLAFPEAPPVLASSKLTVYNGGVKGGVTTLYVVAPIEIPAPHTIVIPVKIERAHDGRHGLRAVAKIPVIAGGSGSLVDFRLRIERQFSYKGSRKSLAVARCPDYQLSADLSALFSNEVHDPGVAATTAVKGRLVSPCTPTG